jgi:endosialidase-like protein
MKHLLWFFIAIPTWAQYSPPVPAGGGGIGGATNCPTANQIPFIASAGVVTCDSGLAYAGAGGVVTQTQNALGVTPTDSVLIQNITPAALGAQQYSPAWDLCGRGWETNTSASQAVCFRAYTVPVQGAATPSGVFYIDHGQNGSFANALQLNSSGTMTIAGGLVVSATQFFTWNGRDILYSPANAQLEITNASANAAGIAATATGDVSACYNGTSFQLTFGSVCGTSLAVYKEHFTGTHGIDYVMRMHPVSFDWKGTGKPDIGLIADEVAAIDPLFGAYDQDGTLYNFRDRPVLATLIKAVQDEQTEIDYLLAR